MPRAPRAAEGGMVYHAFNRANAKMTIFENAGDYEAFEKVVEQALERQPMRILSYVVMPNHWHFVLWPYKDGDLSAFMYWLTMAHTQRWHAFHGTTGTGHLYQGRFKSFPVQDDNHLLTVCRYVERNALAAGLVQKAEDWQWGSLWRRDHYNPAVQTFLHAGPLALPDDWIAFVNSPQTAKDVAEIDHCTERGRPFGDIAWADHAALRLGIERTLRPLGRPRKRLQEPFSQT
jgi:putative transposase